MREKGVNQKELAERMGITDARVSQLLSGNGSPSLKTIQRIGEALGVRFWMSYEESPPGSR